MKKTAISDFTIKKTDNGWYCTYFSQSCKVSEALITATAMCSSGFKTQNFKYRTNDDSRTNVKERTNTAIAYSRC